MAPISVAAYGPHAFMQFSREKLKVKSRCADGRILLLTEELQLRQFGSKGLHPPSW